MWGETGIGRLFSGEIGGQVAWLLPAALVLLAAGFWFTARRPRTDRVRAALVLWGGWLLVTGLTFSFMAGIFHAYYTVALAPAVAALVGIGAHLVWERRRTWEAGPVAAGIDPGHAGAGGRDQAARLVEPQGAQGDPEVAGEVADGEATCGVRRGWG